ncbi:IS66 family insertion sequence element accessory protein TnpA [Glaciecola punicea]|uniref:IS66 family insertion sequence element accessory protein TnpA n=1 Tax=Glaciecola punicea TaxID=56804 RepID=UPI003CC7EDD5
MKTKQTQSYWQHISQWQKSTLSQTKYCKQHGLKTNRFSYHKLKTKPETTGSSGFIKIPVAQVARKERQVPLTLHFTSGLSLSGIEANNVTGGYYYWSLLPPYAPGDLAPPLLIYKHPRISKHAHPRAVFTPAWITP